MNNISKTIEYFERLISETEGAATTMHYVKAHRLWRCRFPQHVNSGRSSGERGRGTWVDDETLEGCMKKAIQFILKHGRPIKNPTTRTLHK